MALNPFFSLDRSIFDPFVTDKLLDPFPFLDNERSRKFSQDASALANTRMDWLETPEAHVFKADLPGLKREEIKVQVEDGRTLQISGERKKEEVQETDKWHRVERVQGSFLRKFHLPENAKVADGVLTITIPKVVKPKGNVRNIEISG